MSESFDPYYKWLGISPGEQKNYYRLLGLNLYESDSDVIENLADQRMNAIRNHQIKYRDEATKILNELSKARVTLLDSKKKKKYDQELQRTLSNGAISINEPPVITRPPRPDDFQQSQQTVPTGEIPVTTLPPRPEEFQQTQQTLPSGEIPVTTPPPKPDELQQADQLNNSANESAISTQITYSSSFRNRDNTSHVTTSSVNNQLTFRHEIDFPVSNDFGSPNLNDEDIALLNEHENNSQTISNQNNLPISSIGYLEKISKINNTIAILDEEYNNCLSEIHNQRSERVKQQNYEIQKLKTKFWKELWPLFIIPGIVACILLLWSPLLACSILISLPLLYVIIRHFSIQESVQNIENYFKPIFNSLDQKEEQLNNNCNTFLNSPELRICFTGQQINFLNKLTALFHKASEGEDVICMKPINYGAQIENQYSKSSNVSFINSNPNSLLQCSLPTIIIEDRLLFFFPQGILIEDNGRFFEISYENVSISQYEYCQTVEIAPKIGADVAGTFWKHTRVDGRQDMRYKNNPQYFIVRYWGVQIHSNSHNMSNLIYFSSKERSNAFITELSALIRTAPSSPRIS